MKTFITSQINKTITGLENAQKEEKNNDLQYYEKYCFNVAFEKSISILSVLTDLCAFLENKGASLEEWGLSRNGFIWNKLNGSVKLINLLKI